MQFDLNLDESLLARAQSMSGLTDIDALVHAGLKALVEKESARRLAQLGGSDPAARRPSRRKPVTRHR